jgi:hypothetical protein
MFQLGLVLVFLAAWILFLTHEWLKSLGLSLFQPLPPGESVTLQMLLAASLFVGGLLLIFLPLFFTKN